MIAPPLALAAVFAITQARAHSWLHCTDYRGNLNIFNQSECFGFPVCESDDKLAFYAP